MFEADSAKQHFFLIEKSYLQELTGKLSWIASDTLELCCTKQICGALRRFSFDILRLSHS